jgi:succinoglycan biosynthesis protein ExoH
LSSIPSLLSRRIDLLRVMLILGIMYIHVPAAAPGPNAIAELPALQWLVLFFTQGLFRVGVPCLSFISGYLLATRWPGGFGAVASRKARSILMPFLIFNGISYAIVLFAQSLGGAGSWPALAGLTPSETLTALFALEGNPVNVPLYFLRDLLVCLLLSPLLLALVRRWPVAVLLGAAALMLWGGRTYLLLRPDILLSFLLGLTAACRGWNVTRLDRFAPAAALLLMAICGTLATVAMAGVPETPLMTMLRKLCLFAGLACVWAIAGRAAQFAASAAVARRARFSFVLFCAHFPLLVPVAAALQEVGLAYPLVFLITPILAGASIMAACLMLERWAPSVLDVIAGSRRSPQASNRLACPASGGGLSPKWTQPRPLRQRPRAVRAIRPSWIR